MVEGHRAAALILALVLMAGACGDDGAESAGTKQSEIKALPADLLPSAILGLAVTSEPTKEVLGGRDRTYLDGIGLYSLRSDDLVQATLQVSKFNDDADYKSAGFRATIVAQVGSAKSRPARLGERTVYLTTGTRQRITLWFQDRYLFILAVRDEFDRPRTLLRKALEIDP